MQLMLVGLLAAVARFGAGLRRAGVAGQGAGRAAARRPASARSRAARHRLPDRDRGARRVCAAAAAAAVAHAGAARPAPRCRAAAAAGRSSRSVRRCWPSPSSSTGCCATCGPRSSFVGGLVGLRAGGRRARAGCCVWLTTRFRGGVGVSWRYGLANLGRRRTESVVQLTAFAHGIMMLLLLAVVRNDLLNDWRRSLPADTPNFFFINIPPDEHQAFTAVPRGARREARARAADGARAHDAHQRQADRRHRRSRRARGTEFANRDQNITWAEQLGARQRNHRGPLVHAGGLRQAARVGVDRIRGGDESQARRHAAVRHRRRDAQRAASRACAR